MMFQRKNNLGHKHTLHLFQCLGFKLTDALGGDAVLARQFVQRRHVVGQPAALPVRPWVSLANPWGFAKLTIIQTKSR